MIALADDAGTDAVADEAVADAAAPEATAPAEEAPAEEPPAEEPAAEEPAAEEPPAEEPPAEEPPAGVSSDASGASSGGAAAASSDGSGSTKKGNARIAAGADDVVIQNHGGLHGGDVSLDYVAAGPFTYDHSTGLGTFPTFGFNDRTIDKDDGVVESLESGDFECDDHVTFFTQIVIDDEADGPGTVELHQTWGMEPTGQPGLGFESIVSVAINTPDDGNVGNVADNVVTLEDEFTETQGYDQLHGIISVTNLAPGETAIVRIIVILGCTPGNPTGNILNDIQSATADGQTVSVGQQTVPMKVTGFVAEPAIDIEKVCPDFGLVGDQLTYDISLTNNGNVDLENIVVMDTVNGHPAVAVPSAPTTLASQATADFTFTYTVLAGDPSPLTNTVTVTADPAGSDSTQVTDTAQCATTILHPAVEITKECPDFGIVGDLLTYEITVTNTGDEDLENVVVSDTVEGQAAAPVPGAPTTLDIGESVDLEFTYTVQAGDPDDLDNSVTVTADGVTSEAEVTDTADCDTTIRHPSIEITKECPDFAVVGDLLTYEITVTNTGDEDLENVVVTDTVEGQAAAPVPGAPTTLDAGQSVDLEFTYEVQEGDPSDLDNSVTVTADGVDTATAVTDTADCDTTIRNPSIEITKECPDFAVEGDVLTYSITVTNTGDEDLENVVVTDTVEGQAAAPVPGAPTTLDAGQSVDLEFTYEVQEGDPSDLDNSVTVTADGVDTATAVTDTADCDTTIRNPSIEITKECPDFAVEGDVLTYSITVTNTGDEDLENVVITDTVEGQAAAPVPGAPTTLTAGQSVDLEFTYEVQEGDPSDLDNTVTVTADGVDTATEVSSSADCDTTIRHPSIEITKECPDFAVEGDVLTYSITVTNTGDEDLENVVILDTVEGQSAAPVPGAPTTLTAGQSVDLEFTYTVQEGDPSDLDNSVTVTADGVDTATAVTDTADCDTTIRHPSIEITKECPAFSAVGETITYSITVTNTGDEDLANVIVMDAVNGHGAVAVPGAPTELVAGESVELEFTYTVQEGDPDPLPNSVTVTAIGVDTETAVTASAGCSTDLLNPAIDIVKTVSDDTVPVGTTVTYTYVITNTGDATLFDVTVDDDVLGHIGDIEVLEPGQSVTMTKDFVVGDAPVVNVAIAEGEDILGRSVSADDDALVTPIIGNPPPPPTPFTGSDASRLAMIAMGLFGLGAALVATTRRRRARQTA